MALCQCKPEGVDTEGSAFYRSGTQHYKSAPENLREIASQLGVAHILEGSVQISLTPQSVT
jgi:hypothetical protein